MAHPLDALRLVGETEEEYLKRIGPPPKPRTLPLT